MKNSVSIFVLLLVLSLSLSPFMITHAEVAENSWTTKEPMPTTRSGVGLASAANPPTQWIKDIDIGSFFLGSGHSVIQTADGGYAITGGKDGGFLLLKTDPSGDVQWEKTYGTEAEFESFAHAIVQAEDGGYVLAGQGTPWPNWIGPNGTLFNLLKTDPAGNMQWNRSYSTEDTPFIATSLIKTSDGGYAVAGYAEKGHTIMGSGTGYVCLIKTDEVGTIQWKKQFTAEPIWALFHISVVETDNAEYALLTVADFTENTVPVVENVDFWLIKTDSTGNMQWSKTYGGAHNDFPRAFIETTDGGFLLAGSTYRVYSLDSFVTLLPDAWLVKTDSEGSILWNKTYGGDGWDGIISSVLESSDGGYVVVAMMTDTSLESYDIRLFFERHGIDVALQYGALIFKTDTSGNTEWTVKYQGVTQPALRPHHIIETADGAYVCTASKSRNYTEPNSIVLVKFTSLSEIPDTTPPTISTVSPENKTYTVNNVSLTFAVSEPTSWIGYSLDAKANVTITGNAILEGLSDGTHSLVVYAKDIAGNMGSETIYFAVDTTSPIITILSPGNRTYDTTGIPLNFTATETTSWIGYSLDRQANVTISGNTTLTELSDGSHSLTVYATDTAGNTGTSETIHFSIAQQSEPFPIWIVATIIIIATTIGGAVLLIYFTKVKKSKRELGAPHI